MNSQMHVEYYVQSIFVCIVILFCFLQSMQYVINLFFWISNLF